MAHGHFFIERVGREQHLEVAGVKVGHHLDDLHLHRVSLIREGLAVAEHQRHITGAVTRGTQGIPGHRRVRIVDIRTLHNRNHLIQRGIHHISVRYSRALAKGLELGGKAVDRVIP